jgi:hypothetical protein
MHACLLHVYVRALLYLMLIIMGIGHGPVHVHLCSNRDRSLSCLRHPFGNVTLFFYKSPNGFNLLADKLPIAMCHPIWLLSRKYGTVWYRPASSKLWYLTTLSFVNFQEKLTGTSRDSLRV